MPYPPQGNGSSGVFTKVDANGRIILTVQGNDVDLGVVNPT